MCVSESRRLNTNNQISSSEWPRFGDIPEPTMVALYTANGSGTKLYQGFLDGHPQIYMVPVYPLMYFYPHWFQWREEMKDNWNWKALIDVFCIKHASLIDTRRIPGHDGLAGLGDEQDEFLSIDEALFREYLAHLLDGEPVSARTFLLAVHYAYAFCRGEDLSKKKVLVYHIHVHEYLPQYLFADFPDALVLGTVRDPRSNIRGRYNSSEVGVDLIKMNKTDALIFRRRVYYFIMRYMFEGLDILNGYPQDRIRMIRHEDLYYKPEAIMRATAKFLGIDYQPCMAGITFGGKSWWGVGVYDMEPMNAVNPKVVSKEWQKRIDPLDWFVFEGLYFHYMNKYGYERYKYQNSFLNRLLLFFAMLLPSKVERDVFRSYLSLSYFREFLDACRNEANGSISLKDYSFNAYYRHKWTQKDLNLHRPRWYIELVKKSTGRSGDAKKKDSGVAGMLYIAVNMSRYGLSILSYPIIIFKRWCVTGAAYLRMIRQKNALPDILS
jgi:hypothetical protein